MRKMFALRTAAIFVILGGALLASASAYADDPTGVLLSEQWAKGPPLTREELRQLPAFSDVGPCQRGMQQVAFPNTQGYRCIRNPY